MRPLVSLPHPIIWNRGLPESILDSPEFAEAMAYFDGYPATSLLYNGAHARAFIYLLVRVFNCKRALEIGTYKAGTTEVFARALWANGGHIDTVDPYGGATVPAALDTWPAELRACCTSHIVNSMTFFHQLVLHPQQYDIAFVDGDHHHEVALFDIGSAAGVLRPGGLLLIDNAEQPGVREAAKRFLREHKGWEFVGPKEALRQHPAQNFSDAIMSVPGTGFWLLRAPDAVSLNDLVYAPSAPFDGTVIRGLTLRTGAVPSTGSIRYRTAMQAISIQGLRPIEVPTAGEVGVGDLVAEGGSHRLTFPKPLDLNKIEPDPERVAAYSVMSETYIQYLGTDPFTVAELPTPY